MFLLSVWMLVVWIIGLFVIGFENGILSLRVLVLLLIKFLMIFMLSVLLGLLIVINGIKVFWFVLFNVVNICL